MSERTKAFRRDRDQVAKQHAKHVMTAVLTAPHAGDPTPRNIGLMASTHCAPCSCAMCGNPRKYFRGKAQLSMQELKQTVRERQTE